MKWNGEKIKIDEIIICVVFECVWIGVYFIGQNGDWFSEMCAGECIWSRRKGNRPLRYGDCVLRGDWFMGIG